MTTDTTQTAHYRIGAGKCACGFHAEHAGIIMGDWGDILRAHIRIATERDKQAAARIVAERAAPQPTDEDLKAIFESTRRRYAQMRWGDATLEGIKAVRAALQPAPAVPDRADIRAAVFTEVIAIIEDEADDTVWLRDGETVVDRLDYLREAEERP